MSEVSDKNKAWRIWAKTCTHRTAKGTGWPRCCGNRRCAFMNCPREHFAIFLRDYKVRNEELEHKRRLANPMDKNWSNKTW